MATELTTRLGALDDLGAVRFLSHFTRGVFEGLATDRGELLAAVPDAVRQVPGFADLVELPAEARRAQLPSGDSVRVARALLRVLAAEPAFAPVLERALDEYRDDEMVAEIILSAGLAISMIIATATTRLTFTAFGMQVTKEVASPELVKAAVEPVAAAVGKVAGSSGSAAPASAG